MKFDKLFFRHDEAVALGSADKAIILEFVRWSCHFKEADANREYLTSRYFHDGNWWMQDSQEAWLERLPWLSIRTFQRYVNDLCDVGLLIRIRNGRTTGRDPNFYRADPNCQFVTNTLTANLTPPSCQFDRYVDANLADTSLSKNHTKNQLRSVEPGGSDLSLDIKLKPKKYDDEDLAIAEAWLEYALGEMRWKKPHSSWTKETFAKDLAKIRRVTGMTHDGLRELLAFVRKDSFWMDKALSPIGLLKKNATGSTKIDNILLQATKKERKNDKIMAMINSKEDPF